MTKKYLLTCLLFFISFSLLTAQSERTHQLALEGIDFASSLQYEKAIDVFNEIIRLEPENPQGYFLKSAAYFWIFSTDMHNEVIGDTLKNWSFRAVEVAEKKLEKNENDIDAMFYLGGAYGTLGRYYGLTGSYLKAYWYGKKGKNYLEDVVELDSTYYDAYLGLGIYHYLADVLPRFVKMLSFILGIEGDKEQGIRELNLVVKKGIYTQSEAMFFLSAIYTYREHEYEKALEIFNQLLKKYPDNPGVLIHLGRCYANMGNCEHAYSTYMKILQAGDLQNRLPLSSIHYQLGNVQMKMNKFNEAKNSFLQSILSDSSSSGNRRWTYHWSYYRLGLCYELTGEREKAVTYYKKIIESANNRIVDRAKRAIEKPMSKIDIEIYKNENLINCKNTDLAISKLEILRNQIESGNEKEEKSKLPEIYLQLGRARFYALQYEEAIEILNKIFAFENFEDEETVFEAHYMLGECYRKTGQNEKALNQYDLAADTDRESLQFKIEEAMKKMVLKK